MKWMKKYLAGVALTLSFAAGATERSPATLGVEGGVNFENASSVSDISSSTQTGWMAGLNFDVPLDRHFSLMPEALYSRRGSDFVDSSGISLAIRQHSIQIPLLLKAKVGEKVRPYAFAGPVAIFNVSNSVAGTIGGQSTSTSYNPRTVDFAVTGGIGLEVGPVFTNLRYTLGLLGIDDNHTDWKSRGFQLLLGIAV